MLPKATPNIHAKTRSGGGSRRLLPVAYIYPLFCRWFGGRSLASAPTLNRRISGWRLRVWQCHRTRNEVERVRGGGLASWGRLGSGAEYCGARQGGAMERRRPDAKGGQTASPD